jgi:hypothetical protein
MYRDVRFEFLKDNPFHDDIGHAKRKQLIEYMDSHVNEFTEKKEGDISFTYINPSITQLFGVRVSDNNIYENPLINHVKDFVMNSLSMPETLKRAFSKVTAFNVLSAIEQEPEEVEEDEPEPERPQTSLMESQELSDENEQFDPITPIIPEKFSYNRTSGLTNYDITTNKLLTYDDVRRLTTNIARSELTPVVQKEEYKMKLEEQKRLELQEEINQYRKIRDIGALTQDDISEMTLTQLTELARAYKKAYDEKKLYTVFKKGGNILTTITSTVFPNGIRIGKDEQTGNERYIQMKGAVKEITNQIFDNSSVQGHAFGNLLKKANINISDSVLAVISIFETMISNIQVVEVPVNGNQKAIDTGNGAMLAAIEDKTDEKIYDYDEEEDGYEYSGTE